MEWLALNNPLECQHTTRADASAHAQALIDVRSSSRCAVVEVRDRLHGDDLVAANTAYHAVSLYPGMLVGSKDVVLAKCRQEMWHFANTLFDYLLCEIIEIHERPRRTL